MARFLCTLLIALPAAAHADDIEGFGERGRFQLVADDLVLSLSGRAELELHDLEGKGGPGHDSATDRRTLGTRSPTAELDAVWLAVGLHMGDVASAYWLLEAGPDRTRAAAIWAEVSVAAPARLTHRVRAGFHPPLAHRDRRTERYPLLGTIYWRESELQIAYGVEYGAADWASVSLDLSLSMMRPLGFAPVQDSRAQPGTINVLAYGSARTFSGNRPVYGARFRTDLAGLFVEAFGFLGRLAAEAGTDVLRTTLSRFSELSGFNHAELEQQNRRFYWVGGRLGYDDHGLHAHGEAIVSRESLLRRWGAYGQLSYEVSMGAERDVFHTLEPILRYEVYRIVGGSDVQASGRALRSPARSEAVTWDFDVLTAGLAVHIYRDLILTRLEYAWVSERNGVPGLGVPSSALRNNELLVQLAVGF